MSTAEAINKRLLEDLEAVEKDIADAVSLIRSKALKAQQIKDALNCPHTVTEYSAWAEIAWYKCKACGAEVDFAG
jgi:hypothetical protein